LQAVSPSEARQVIQAQSADFGAYRQHLAGKVAATETTASAQKSEQGAGEAGADEYKVHSGDTLSRIASRAQRPGISLDQMLVGLYRGNPQAFLGDNMNRLKSGVVLSVPSVEKLQAVSPSEARQVIQAQSADFGAYRQHLAGKVAATETTASAQKAGGQVQGEVQDRKQAAATAPDKLTLSKGSAAAGAAAPEQKLAEERAKKDAANRVAELSKNVEDLKKLQSAGTAPAAKTAPAPKQAPGVAVPAAVGMAPVVSPPPAPAPAKPPAAAASTPAVVATAASTPPAPIKAQAPAASAPAVVAAAATPASAPAAAAASAAVAATPAPAPRPPAPAPVPAPAPAEEPGFFANLLDNPLVLPAVGAFALVAGGFGWYRMRAQKKQESGETSFLESRLQPDSFFGASGGQRVDTRDATGVPSSMSYSLSQLDAIGDVDPVAEADVYLAYGRDLQAEEILKEAMRSAPDRLAIRTKLLEVYAKRRDTKGFELLANQLYSLTGGQGEDWAKTQELGLSIDPDNSLYRPGGHPASAVPGAVAGAGEVLGASTMPQSVLPSPSRFEAGLSGIDAPDSGNVDLDLDLPAAASKPAARSSGALGKAPTPFIAPSFDAPATADAGAAKFDLPTIPLRAEAHAASGPLDFDMGGLDLDLPSAPASSRAPAAEHFSLDVGNEAGDALARKLELAEEFRQIGDTEGARDLLKEVVAQASGSLKTKAQGMLDALA
ncbi:MAG TPA: FimV/HubP family polar landmark protein, partial [Methylibium sp.]